MGEEGRDTANKMNPGEQEELKKDSRYPVLMTALIARTGLQLTGNAVADLATDLIQALQKLDKEIEKHAQDAKDAQDASEADELGG